MTTDTSCGTVRADRARERIHRLEFDVPWPPKHVAAYLLEGEETILFDAGAPDDAGEAELREGLAAAGYEPEDVDHVVVTHVHSDHIGQLPVLRDVGATVHVPTRSLSRLERDLGTAREGFEEMTTAAGYDGDKRAEIVEEELEELRRDRRLIEPETAREIEPDATVAIGGREFETFATPGHAVDHLCLETTVEGTTVLFSGDALIEPFRAGAFQVGLDRGADVAVDAYYEAMDRLSATDATLVFPGHGPVFEGPQAVIENTRDRLDALLEETRDAAAAVGPASPLAIAEQRVGTVRHMAPLLDTIGALGTLERRGSITSETRDGVRYYELA
ncbi:MBL fold metallo-hydrolase [Natrinema saccharevitans]|uniref:MBL fold metallo-hydrolase n=1 Tax=Natrinema saccharevitans TaxID=301967 RepID=A0A1S8AXD2_9EURY|nr:MBL fold metallo-hydrolase [Natrinema saccharevitans]OLZ41375.1 MBL fold metallo-hydrolase [Natrinema saccharevitans]